MAIRALIGSSDIPTTASRDRLAHRTGEQRSTDLPELSHIFISSRHGGATGHLFIPFNQLHCSSISEIVRSSARCKVLEGLAKGATYAPETAARPKVERRTR